MKKFHIEYSVLANSDLADIWEYFDEYDRETANNFVLGIKERVLKLKQFPFSGAKMDFFSKNERFIIFKKYNIFYRIMEDEGIVFIRRILHGAREVKELL